MQILLDMKHITFLNAPHMPPIYSIHTRYTGMYVSQTVSWR